MSEHHSAGDAARIGWQALVLAAALIHTSTAGGDSLFKSIGGEAVLKTVVSEFTNIVIDDDRINFTFAQSDLDKFKRLLYEQLCEITGGPCHYSGRDMRSAHEKLKINDAEFNALAEDLYIAFEHAHVPYRLQNRVMALLAPMHRDIVK